MKDMYRGLGPWSFEIPRIHPSSYHSVLIELPPSLQEPPTPYVGSHTFHWDDGYVRMPFSKKNLYPSTDDDGRATLVSRWKLIKETYQQQIQSSRDLEAAINVYNSRLSKFDGLQYFLDEVFNEEECDHFFGSLLPNIIKLALKLPEVLPGSIPLLKLDTCKSVSLSQLQIASLLANAFLCTFPWKKDVATTYSSINFHSLFQVRTPTAAEKLKCLIHYFRRVTDKAPVGVVTFERQHIRKSNNPRWDRVTNNLGNTRLHVSSSGTIEDDGLGLLQVDFANKFIGGGVLGYGCVQEEIRFAICPELIISRLFTEKLNNNEAIIITGAERYSKYTGYADTFEWDGDFKDETPFDSSGRRQTTITAIDAIQFNKPNEQFSPSMVLRELNKAYAGFYSRFNGILLSPIATGNWGCGAFRGDPHLKFLIQLMASNAAQRDVVYYTFSNTELLDNIYNMYTFIATNQITICQLWRLICRFNYAQLKPDKFFPYIQQAFFDSQKQPSIKTFLKISPETPSTSSEHTVPPLSSPDEDIIIEVDESPENSPNTKRKCVVPPSEPTEVLSLIDKIDGKVCKTEMKQGDGLGVMFLECVDDYSKKAMVNRISSLEDMMDVDEILENIGGETKSPSTAKRKITDYFSKN